MESLHGRRLIRMKFTSCRIFACRAAMGGLLLALSAVTTANPTASPVVTGPGNVQTSGGSSNTTIFNWSAFAIGADQLVRYVNNSELSAVLNRISSQDPSAIIGSLQSNGRVLLIHRNGIVFSAAGQVDLGGLVAKSLALSGNGLLGRHWGAADLPTVRAVISQGLTTPVAGHSVLLVGAGATDGSVYDSPAGEKMLAAGKSVQLVDPATPALRVELVAPKNQALRLEWIAAEAGRKGIYAGLLRSDKTINADRVVRLVDGTITLKAGPAIDSAVLAATGGGSGWMDMGAGDSLRPLGDLMFPSPVLKFYLPGLEPAAAFSGVVTP